MNLEFDFEKMKKELIEVSLKTKNKEMFMNVTSPTYRQYISNILGFSTLVEFKRFIGMNITDEDVVESRTQLKEERVVLEWLEEKKDMLHPYIYEFLKEDVALIYEEPLENIFWLNLSNMLKAKASLRYFYYEISWKFGKKTAEDFIHYLNLQKSNE